MKLVKVDIDKVKIVNRVRKDLGDITSLAESIKSEGLINPIAIDEEFNLRRGYRRLSAFKLLKIKKIPAFIVKDSKNKVLDRIIDFIENVNRKDLTWQEKSLFVTTIHNQLVAKSPKWTTDMTAAILHMSGGNVRELLNIVKAPKEVLKAALQKGSSREAYRFINKEKREKLVEMAVRKVDVSDAVETYNGNCIEMLKKLPDESVDIIYTDPPYGIGLPSIGSKDKALSFNEDIYNGSDDNFEGWYELIDTFLGEAHRILKESGWLLMWGAMTNVNGIYELLKKHNFNMMRKPLTLCYSQGLTMAPKYNFGSSSDFLWVSNKGKRLPLVKQGLVDSFYTTKTPPSDREYTLEKPPEVTEYWLPAFIVPGESVVLDAFAGVGSLVSPLFKLGIKKVIGIESDEGRFNKLNKNLKLSVLENASG